MNNTSHAGDRFKISTSEYQEAAKEFQKMLSKLPLDVFVEWLKLQELSPEDRKEQEKPTDRYSAKSQAISLELFSHPKSLIFKKILRAIAVRRLVSATYGNGHESAHRLARRIVDRYSASEAAPSSPIEDRLWWASNVLANFVLSSPDPMDAATQAHAVNLAKEIVSLFSELNSQE